MPKFKDEIGNRYNRLVVLARAENQGSRAMWICQCDCGNITEPIRGYSLRIGETQSCGCYMKDRVFETHKNKIVSKETRKKMSEANKGKNNSNYKHGLSKTNEYYKLRHAKRRALKMNSEGFHTIQDLKYIYDHQKGICGKCREYISFDDMTVDHIVPLSWGGSNYPSNIQLLCFSCNSSKGNRNDIDYRDYIPLFLGGS